MQEGKKGWQQVGACLELTPATLLDLPCLMCEYHVGAWNGGLG